MAYPFVESPNFTPADGRAIGVVVMHTNAGAGSLAELVAQKSAVLQRWMDERRLARVPPEHLIFSIWALTQHYADFETQVRAVLGEGHDPFAEAGAVLDLIFRRLLAPQPGAGAT